MSSAERIVLALVGVAGVTTAILPKRQTIGVIDAFGRLLRGTMATAMGTGKTV